MKLLQDRIKKIEAKAEKNFEATKHQEEKIIKIIKKLEDKNHKDILRL